MRRSVLALVVSLLVVVGGGGVSYLVYQSQKAELVATATDDLRRATEAFTRALTHIFEPALTLGRTVETSGIERVAEAGQRDLFFGIANGPIQQFEQLNGAFLGFPDGRFLHVQDLEIAGDQGAGLRRRIIDQPAEDPAGRWETLDAATGDWTPAGAGAASYDPRSRPWYRSALWAGKPVWTEAYVFASSGKLGVTYARPIYDASGALWAVLGVDLSLNSLSRTLIETADALAGIGDVVFATDLGNKILGHPDFVEHADEMDRDTERFLARYRQADSFERIVVGTLQAADVTGTVQAGGRSFIATKAILDGNRAMPLQIYLARDMDSVLAHAVDTMRRNVVLLFVAIVVFAIVALYAVKLRVEVAARQRAEAELTGAKEVAEAATRAKSTFLATMSHEIRTPMNGVMSMAELLTLTRLDAEQRRMAKVINDSALALLTIINDILDFSKIEAGKLDIERVGFSLAEVVDGCAELLAPRVEAKGLELIVDVDPDMVDGRLGDPTRIRQILLNLGGNAVKFTQTGSVGIRVYPAAADLLRFEVSDTGIGLTPEQQGRLFQAFMQADASTSRKYGGTGLGLSICQRLTQLMGGRIGVQSVAGEGSVFWLELPLPAGAGGPPRYPGDLSDASVCLVGLSDGVAGIAGRWLRATGVNDVRVLSSAGPAEIAGAGLCVADCGAPDLDVVALAGSGTTVALAGSRAKLAALPPQTRAACAMALTLPLSRATLWRAVAVSLGLESADAVAADDREDLAYAPPPVDEARAAGAMVLVAEDNETNQLVIRQMLARMGFACEIAENGRIALDRLDRDVHGLLLTDFNMPEMDGFELARAVRAGEQPDGRRLPILALTADAMAGTEAACIAAGMDGYLTKPVDSRRLGAALAAHLPQALPLRRPAGQDARPAGPAAAPDWDPDVFDPAVLGDAAGGLDQEACELIAGAALAWVTKVQDINRALAASDPGAARQAVHSLKGATLSVGANRLGRIASDMQDALDAGDADFAAILAEVLEPTLDEFRAALPKILKTRGSAA